MEKAQGPREAAGWSWGGGDSDTPVTCGFSFCVSVLKQPPKAPGGGFLLFSPSFHSFILSGFPSSPFLPIHRKSLAFNSLVSWGGGAEGGS